MNPFKTIERFSYPGYGGCDSHCGPIDLYKSNEDHTIFVILDPASNEGTSVCNAIEMVATKLMETFPAMDPEKAHFIVLYDERSYVSGDRKPDYTWARLTPIPSQLSSIYGTRLEVSFGMKRSTGHAWLYLGSTENEALVKLAGMVEKQEAEECEQ
ncbi:MAG: hypothetical protein KKB70_08320 [Proteobacteria bacterium]|nr:hypothetical protein [Pseudomonadota bacterium]